MSGGSRVFSANRISVGTLAEGRNTGEEADGVVRNLRCACTPVTRLQLTARNLQIGLRHKRESLYCAGLVDDVQRPVWVGRNILRRRCEHVRRMSLTVCAGVIRFVRGCDLRNRSAVLV